MLTEIQNLKLDNIDSFIKEVNAKADKRLVVDLQSTDKVERPAASILSAALLGSFAERALEVRLPERLDTKRRISWASLAFALANRPKEIETKIVGGEGLDLTEWKRSWSPGTRSQFDRLFKSGELFLGGDLGESEDEPTMYGRDHAAFVNPHRAPPAVGPTDVTSVVRPWLSTVLPSYLSRRSGSPHGPAFVQDVGLLIDELLENVRDHALQRSEGRPTQSLVHLSIARGGGASTREDGTKVTHRLYLSVLDTGPGIAVTARPKLDLRPAEEGGPRDAEIIRDLLTGRHAGWGRARGLGLPRVWKRVRAWRDAELRIATNAERLRGRDSEVEILRPGFDIRGTVIIFMVPLPPSPVN
ncbi:hypothetical protein BE17_49410 [Sorangium cellulosum]|uniref:Histidine kinase/HSP90-like ATPase domain-containing protein n=1 Tax=Sorangium cellulosum TaxID=56 RepID=A0A150RVP4_SORCE|nr:hypothetical protein BE17_49410 [Sorangium cellulosum]